MLLTSKAHGDENGRFARAVLPTNEVHSLLHAHRALVMAPGGRCAVSDGGKVGYANVKRTVMVTALSISRSDTGVWRKGGGATMLTATARRMGDAAHCAIGVREALGQG